MVQQQAPIKFSGLNLTSNGGELPPGASPVFHNCDLSSDGDVVRRGGSNYIDDIEVSGVRTYGSYVIKTRKESEYLVTVSSNRLTIQLIASTDKVARVRLSVTKFNVFKTGVPPTNVSFVQLSAPYDRLLILSSNYPPIQVSFLERTSSFVCTNEVTGTLVSEYNTNDSPLWRNTDASGSALYDPLTDSYFALQSKSPGFTLNCPSFAPVLGSSYTLTLVNISWQWWSEAITWKGADFAQNTVRYSTTAIDQSVKIPVQLLTDLDARYLESAYRGIFFSLSNNLTSNAPVYPSVSPASATEWSHSSGQRYVYSATNPLLHAPFFATFAGIETIGTQTPLTFFRFREIRLNAGTGCAPDDMDVFVNGALKTFRPSVLSTNNPGDYVCNADTFTTQRNRVAVTTGTTIATTISPHANGTPLSSQSTVTIVNKSTKWLGSSARSVAASNLPVGGGVLDGCYVPAYGIGTFSDYLRGQFPPFGCIFRDRLVLKTSSESIDQLVVSTTGDEYTPGEYYSFFQVTDALDGQVDDPFTINITTKSREKLTALLPWQQALFVFTAVSTYSISGGEAFGPESYTTGLVASYGAFNQRCVVPTNLTILFLNRFGVFDLLNKNNTTDYGSFEKSEAVRPLFTEMEITQAQSSLPWLCLNDTTNKAYMGLPETGDTQYCSRILSMNLSWNSWSTVSSATPFSVAAAMQVLNLTIFVVLDSYGTSGVLQMEALHHLDYCRSGSFTSPFTSVPFSTLNPTPISTVGDVVVLPHPSPPVLREYLDSSTYPKVGTTYYTSTYVGTPRNWMHDISELAPLLGASDGSVVAAASSSQPFIMYPQVESQTSTTISLGPITSLSESIVTTLGAVGVIYPSIFATTPFNLDSMGRLKRLKKLHLLFDNASTLALKFPTVTGKIKNSAIAIINSNYGEDQYIADTTLIGDYTRLDDLSFDKNPSARVRDQISIPLQGYGADYQMYLCSTGGDAFKLKSYEFDVQAQRTKTYVK